MASEPVPASVQLAASAPASDDNLQQCFICLLNSAETPGTTWVTPCPCTLEAHEDCLLQWVAEYESSNQATGRPKTGLRCPACNERIHVVEPYSTFIDARNRLHRVYSRLSPGLLLGFIGTCGVAGSAWYGMLAMSVFAGPRTAIQWTGFSQALQYPHPVWWKWGSVARVATRLYLLNLIGPALLLHKAIPSIGSMLFLPPALVYGSFLIGKNHMPSWPPSPAWAIVAMPYVNITYRNVYWALFGNLEERLRKALRGRSVSDDAPAQDRGVNAGNGPGQQNANADAAGGIVDAAAAPPAAENVHEDDGAGAVIFGWANAVLDLFGGNDEVVIEAEVRMGGGAGGGDFDEGEGADEEGFGAELIEFFAAEAAAEDAAAEETAAVPVAAAEPRAEPPVEQEPELQPQPQAAAEEAAVDGDEDAGIPPVPIEPARQNHNQNNHHVAAADDFRPRISFSGLVNEIVSALAFPYVCFEVGEVLRFVLPARLVTLRRGPFGLLQQRWGRSLLGGCIYVVLRDAFSLYSMYRMVEVRKHRRIKNVKRRADRRGGGATAPAA